MTQITHTLPLFSDIQPELIEDTLTQLLSDNNKAITEILSQTDAFTWDNLMQPLEDLDDRLHQFWSPISHLYGVANTSALRLAYQACLPKLSRYYSEIGQNHALFSAIAQLAESDEARSFNTSQQQIITHALRDFRLSGVDLNEEDKKTYIALTQDLSHLTTTYADNVLDATQAYQKHITDEKLLEGLPDFALQAAKQSAEAKSLTGWLFTLDIPSYLPVMQYAQSAELRKELYTAYVTRASKHGPQANEFDNTDIIQDILNKRHQLANLLNFPNYADYSLATKMVRETQEVIDFLSNLADSAMPQAKEEYQALCTFAKNELSLDSLNPWDVGYASEKMRLAHFDISEDTLRPYFPEHIVTQGLFTIVNRLFNITIKPLNDADVWHPDVTCYAVYDDNDQLISFFYLDLYARSGKRGGAWMDDCQIRRRCSNNDIQLPIAFITCNFNGPINDDPALFSHSDVITLFHEFGHSLQHMLTQVEYADVSGINGIPWDAVEIASQFLENWAWQKSCMPLITQHYQTHEPLPEELFTKMKAARNFQSAMQMARQLELSLFDFCIHLEYDSSQVNFVQETLDNIRSLTSVTPVAAFNCFQNSFSHIFAGGYAAGYYSYKWAEVMSCDAFSLFIEQGIFDQTTSQRFKETFLALGGSKEPMDVFIEFRGRKPSIDALLDDAGITASTPQ